MMFRALATFVLLCAAAAVPAAARVSVLQVVNRSDHCATVEVFVAQDTRSDMFRLPYQKDKAVKPGASDAFSAIKGHLPAMHLLVRAFIQKNADCTGGVVGVAQDQYFSPGAPLEVPTATIVNVGSRFRLIFPRLVR